MAERIGKELEFLKSFVNNSATSRKKILKNASAESLKAILECIINTVSFDFNKRENKKLSKIRPILTYIKRFRHVSGDKVQHYMKIERLRVMFIKHHGAICAAVGLVLSRLLIESIVYACNV
jgi:hypothetical protein